MEPIYLPIGNGRIAIIEANLKANTTSELFKELGEDDIIPEELWYEPQVHIEIVQREGYNPTNVIEPYHSRKLTETIIGIEKPKDMTVREYWS